MRPPEDVAASIEEVLASTIESIEPVGGGCISHASRVRTADGTYFLKWASGAAGATFVAEGRGLEALDGWSTDLLVPKPILRRNADSTNVGLLLMDWIDEEPKSKAFWQNLGTGLATLHKVSSSNEFGLDHDNFIGRLPQRNTAHRNWVEFFADRRIGDQVDMARRLGRWNGAWDRGLDGLLQELTSLLPSTPPASLVHGDLWSGNVLASTGATGVLIDPAVYRADREVDLAMSELFGGFSSDFYAAYDDVWPTDAGYAARRDVYNLYHLINHLNHFGSAYSMQVASIIRRFE